MIEGLRQLPWLQERIRNDRATVERYLDCDACRGIKQSYDVRPSTLIERQVWGCGWEPRNEDLRPCGWMHQGYTDAAPTTCPGFTTKLPEVIEIAKARLHWKEGALRDFCGGVIPTEMLLRGIEILEGSVNEANCWRPEGKK